jgi:hypothetical protein
MLSYTEICFNSLGYLGFVATTGISAPPYPPRRKMEGQATMKISTYLKLHSPFGAIDLLVLCQ